MGTLMHEQDAGFDIDRYRRLLTEAVDERKRLALIDLLIRERARDRLQAHRAAGNPSSANATRSGTAGTSGPQTMASGAPLPLREGPFPATASI
jgi:hypothetical protein